MSQTVLRRVVSVLMLVIVVVAIARVAVPFTDRSVNCGTAFASAQHGVKAPGLTSVDASVVTLCRSEARSRLVESGAAITVAVVWFVFSRRRDDR